MDKWFEAYSTWPPINQMVFSIIVLIVSLVFLFLFGLWLFQVFSQVSVWLRGWPEDKSSVAGADMDEVKTLLAKVLEQVCTRKGSLTSLGPNNWREEARRIEEEQRQIQDEAEKDLVAREQALRQLEADLASARREAQRMGEAKHHANGSRPSAKPNVEPLEER